MVLALQSFAAWRMRVFLGESGARLAPRAAKSCWRKSTGNLLPQSISCHGQHGNDVKTVLPGIKDAKLIRGENEAAGIGKILEMIVPRSCNAMVLSAAQQRPEDLHCHGHYDLF